MSTSTQEELPLTQARATDPNVLMFVGYLRTQDAWKTATEVCEELGLPPGESGKRMVRAWASADANIVSGNSGYRHVDLVSIEELREFLGRMSSQRQAMAAREIRARQILHSKIQHAC